MTSHPVVPKHEEALARFRTSHSCGLLWLVDIGTHGVEKPVVGRVAVPTQSMGKSIGALHPLKVPLTEFERILLKRNAAQFGLPEDVCGSVIDQRI